MIRVIDGKNYKYISCGWCGRNEEMREDTRIGWCEACMKMVPRPRPTQRQAEIVAIAMDMWRAEQAAA